MSTFQCPVSIVAALALASHTCFAAPTIEAFDKAFEAEARFGETSLQDAAVSSLVRMHAQEVGAKPHVSEYDGASESMLPIWIRDLDPASLKGDVEIQSEGLGELLEGVRHYRVLPGAFPSPMDYHYDGLATTFQFRFNQTHLSWFSVPFESSADENFDECIFYGTGTGPTLPGDQICFQNPGVNLLPVGDQLWLTIDTFRWGRIDPDTLETLPNSRVQVDSVVLNAHPACDRGTEECFVQHPCGPNPVSTEACISVLDAAHVEERSPRRTDLGTRLLSNAPMGTAKLIQHSHSPCVTPNFVVSKLDSFVPRKPEQGAHGVLKLMHQGEDALWMVMDRRTNTSRIMTSNEAFVNNHFWNCYEDETSDDIVVETVTVTSSYLDYFFSEPLSLNTTDWAEYFKKPLRCRIPRSADASEISCLPLGGDTFVERPIDYPTFNPLWKMRPDYSYFYAVAAQSRESRWLDSVVKVDVSGGRDEIVASWSSQGVFVAEADFVPQMDEGALEDDGFLLTILYNVTDETSSLGVLKAKDLTLVEAFPLGGLMPFQAHGIVCLPGQSCFSNP